VFPADSAACSLPILDIWVHICTGTDGDHRDSEGEDGDVAGDGDGEGDGDGIKST